MAEKTYDRAVLNRRVVVLGPRGTATERSRGRRDDDLAAIPLLHWPP